MKEETYYSQRYFLEKKTLFVLHIAIRHINVTIGFRKFSLTGWAISGARQLGHLPLIQNTPINYL